MRDLIKMSFLSFSRNRKSSWNATRFFASLWLHECVWLFVILIIIKHGRAVVVEEAPTLPTCIVHMRQSLHKFHCAFSEMGLSRNGFMTLNRISQRIGKRPRNIRVYEYIYTHTRVCGIYCGRNSSSFIKFENDTQISEMCTHVHAPWSETPAVYCYVSMQCRTLRTKPFRRY